jgi:EmrB/QacA subfamily drug resistance transporter
MINSVKSPCDEGVIHAKSVHSKSAKGPSSANAGFWILLATILGSSMAFIDGSVVNVALPVLQRELNATSADVQWVVESYSLFLSALILVGGALGDRVGRRRIYTLGVLVFSLSSVWCGLSPNINQLIIARAVQGIGGALLVPGSLAIISASFDEQRRGQAIGTWSGFTSVTSVIGPVLGGWLIQVASWRWVFFINIPLAVVVLLTVFIHVPESRHEGETGGLDWWGALLITVGLAGIVYGLTEASALGWGNPLVLATLVVGILALVAFLYLEQRVKNPMVPLTLFRSSSFSGANLLTFLLYGALGGAIYFLPFNLIQVQGYSTAAAGAALTPFAITMFLLSRWTGGLVKRFGAKLPLIIGPAITTLGFVLFAIPGIGGSYWLTYFPAVMVMSIGMTITVAPLTTTVMNSVDQQEAGTASGINNAVSRTASLLAIALLGIIVVGIFTTSLESQLAALSLPDGIHQAILQQSDRLAGIEIPRGVGAGVQASIKQAVNESFIAAFRVVMLISAGLAIASALISWIMISGKTANRATENASVGSTPKVQKTGLEAQN